MIIAKSTSTNRESEHIYERAIARLGKELGWTPSKAHEVLGELAAGYGVFLDDVAMAVIDAPTIKRGLGQALRRIPPDRRPLELRKAPVSY